MVFAKSPMMPNGVAHEMGRPKFVENCAHGQNEIERGRYPDPILRSRAATEDGRQSPGGKPDDRSIQEVNVKIIQRTRDVLMHGLFLRGYGCSCSLAPRFEELSSLSA